MSTGITANKVFDILRSSFDSVKLTELRKDVLKIIIEYKKPISAAEILQTLKKRRESAEPPTVYRVIEYLLNNHVVHKIASENKYVLCSQLSTVTTNQHGFIFICKKCLKSTEITHEHFTTLLKQLAEDHDFLIHSPLLEIQCICKKCAKKSS